jgi:hypothetical protein
MQKNQFLYVYPLIVLRPELDSSQDSRKVSRGFFRKNQKLAKLERRNVFCVLDCNNYSVSHTAVCHCKGTVYLNNINK